MKKVLVSFDEETIYPILLESATNKGCKVATLVRMIVMESLNINTNSAAVTKNIPKVVAKKESSIETSAFDLTAKRQELDI